MEVPSHTNLITAYDCLRYEETGPQFQLTEYVHDAMNMYNYIQSLKLNLSMNVDKEYLELIYDCIIQVTMALEFAHNHDLIHGAVDLSNILITSDGGHEVFKLTNFKHEFVVNSPL